MPPAKAEIFALFRKVARGIIHSRPCILPMPCKKMRLADYMLVINQGKVLASRQFIRCVDA
ncbi:MAG: hypothetical protein R3E08_06080 [Thiotrichaceae bacterium]